MVRAATQRPSWLHPAVWVCIAAFTRPKNRPIGLSKLLWRCNAMFWDGRRQRREGKNISVVDTYAHVQLQSQILFCLKHTVSEHEGAFCELVKVYTTVCRSQDTNDDRGDGIDWSFELRSIQSSSFQRYGVLLHLMCITLQTKNKGKHKGTGSRTISKGAINAPTKVPSSCWPNARIFGLPRTKLKVLVQSWNSCLINMGLNKQPSSWKEWW